MDLMMLSELKPGEACEIRELRLYGGMRRRLRDLGLLPGVRLQCAFTAPSGSPMAFWVKGAMIALRKNDCKRIAGYRCA